MNMDNCTHLIQLLIVFGGLVLIDGQYLGTSGYGRRRIIGHRRRIHPRYPDPYGPLHIRDPYPLMPALRRPIIRDPYIDGTVPVARIRRPNVVRDSSRDRRQDINIVNNNNNENVREGSNNVVVNQSIRRTCDPPCGPYSSCTDGMCRRRMGFMDGVVGGEHFI
ncbi:uncharacterized protein LOC123555334 [Mercenaria mercenaria]|uniref:uncharacterized protein LOC123555334 n=1 Tax=Mercenaria mercenaria TaxID=6596 RepID=UPI00234F51AC|nr:uncharacterized protein LOC123555334 [Mercenaria mercenaria]